MHGLSLWGVYYSLAVWRFKPILSAGLRFHSHLSGGLRLRNYRAVAGNHKFSLRFLRVFVAVIQTELRGSEDWAKTLPCVKILFLTKDCLLGLNQVSQGFPLCLRPLKGGGGEEVIWYKATLQSFERVTKAHGKMADDVANVDIIKWVAFFYKLGAAPKDFIRKENFRIKLPRSLHKLQQLKEIHRKT